MTRTDWYLIGAAVLACVLVDCALMPKKAHAEPPTVQEHQGHAKGHDVYKDWMRPDYPTSSCCAEKIWHDGNGNRYSTGHCYPADAELRKGKWWVLLDNAKWVEVPDKRILGRVASPNPAKAHVCEHYSDSPTDPIYCFREAVGGT